MSAKKFQETISQTASALRDIMHQIEFCRDAISSLEPIYVDGKDKVMTPETVQKVKDMLALGFLRNSDIASALGINQGRVSEVKNGMYD